MQAVTVLEDLSGYITLRELCQRSDLLEIDAIEVCRDICIAIAEVHAKEYVHNNITCDSIYIWDQLLDVKLLNFEYCCMVNEVYTPQDNMNFLSDDKQ